MNELKIHADPEAERSIFNAILISSDLLGEARKTLSPSDFYRDNHQIIFRAMLDMEAAGNPIELDPLRIHLSDDLEKIGGASYIAGLLKGDSVSLESFTILCDRVKEKSIRRQMLGITDQLWKTAASDAGPEEVAREFEQAREDIRERYEALQPEKERRIHLTGSQLLDREFEDNPIIAGLLARRESLVILGPSGLGKSCLINQIALTGGNPPLNGLFEIFPIPMTFSSLFNQSENTARAQKRRLSKTCKACPELRLGLDRIHFPFFSDDIRQTGVLTDPNFEAMLIDDLAATGADVLILDPLISFHGEDENDNGAMRRTLDRLTLICDRADVACIVVHHVSKAVGKNDVFPGRGASAIGDWAANILVMAPVLDKAGERTNIIEMRHHKARNYETKPTFFLERTKDLLFLPTANPNDVKGLEQVQCVVSCLDEMGGSVETKLKLETAIAERTGKGRSTAQRMIRDAVDRGILLLVPGEGRREGVVIAHDAQKRMGNGI